MTQDLIDKQIKELAEEIQAELYRHSGPLLFGEELYAALGYPSGNAFRQALCREQVPVEIFSIANRRGKFALSKDVALWIAQQRFQSTKEGEDKQK